MRVGLLVGPTAADPTAASREAPQGCGLMAFGAWR
jgi:hypothetical protein